MNPPRAKDSQLKDTQEPENNQLNPITTETLQQTGSLKETPSLEGDGMKKTPRVITIGECGEILEQTMSDLIPSQQEQPQDKTSPEGSSSLFPEDDGTLEDLHLLFEPGTEDQENPWKRLVRRTRH